MFRSWRLFAALSWSIILLSGCGPLAVYRLDIQQGNVLTQQAVDGIRHGMTAKQVEFVLGAPVLRSIFRPARMEYVQYLRTRGKKRAAKRLVLFFEDGVLVAAQGDFDFSNLDAPLDKLDPLVPDGEEDAASLDAPLDETDPPVSKAEGDADSSDEPSSASSSPALETEVSKAGSQSQPEATRGDGEDSSSENPELR